MFPAARRLVVIGDVHGDCDRLVKALQIARVISQSPTIEWVADPADTMVVQLGDQLDSANRNPEAAEWESQPDVSMLALMDNLDSIAKQHGGRVISLIGNHEIMNLTGEFVYVSNSSLTQSGGEEVRRREFMPGGKYNRMLLSRYIIVKVGTYLFCHAGLLPSHLNTIGENIQEFNNAFWMMASGALLSQRQQDLVNDAILSVNGILWNRKYVELLSQPNMLKTYLSIVLRTTKCTTMFIGHNTLENIVVAADGGLVFTDAGFSRSYGARKFQFIDILDGKMNIVQVTEN